MKPDIFKNRWLGAALLTVALWPAARLHAMPEVDTVTGGPSQFYPQTSAGYVDGNTASEAKFNSPYALALDSTGTTLFVADRDNNAIRFLDSGSGYTFTFANQAQRINQPVGVAVDSFDNVYVLNRGTGSTPINGNVLSFDRYGDFIKTNAVALTNAYGMTLDGIANIYVTVGGNSVLRITPAGVRSTVATISHAGAALRGIVFKRNGLLAVCDSGRHGIYLINPDTGVVTTNAGFRGAGDFVVDGNNVASSTTAKFNQPMGVTEAGDGTLVVSDFGNHRVKVVLNSGVVTNLYGMRSGLWYTGPGAFPGWWDGTVTVPDLLGGVEARQPVAVVFAPDGTVYTTETYYHLIRKVTSTGLPQPPPPPPQVPAPSIGWVDFPYPDFLSVLHPGSSFVFNNDVMLAIRGTAGSQTFFTSGPRPGTGSIPDPSPINGSTPPAYSDNLPSSQVTDLPITKYPDMLIKAIGTKTDGSPPSAVIETRIQFVTANPIIIGNNASSFLVTNLTTGAQMWYTIDGSDPTNAAPSLGPIPLGGAMSLTFSNDFPFKVRGFRTGYQPSGVVTRIFSTTNYTPNRISFGLTNGEPSSAFIARPGQYFYAPVTLQLQPEGETMYSLQFNVGLTNGLINTNTGVRPPAIVNGAGIDFFSMLVSDVPKERANQNPPPNFAWYLTIPPFLMSSVSNLVEDSIFLNTNNNILGVGWLYRPAFEYMVINTNTGKYLLDFDTTKHDLIKFSMAHDTLFEKVGGVVVVGAYGFGVPDTAVNGDTYFIQLGSPSATRDGVGAPGAEVTIQAPASNQRVTVGTPSYLVGDVAPFRWLNAGDFGQGMLNNADVMQVFQSAILELHIPPFNSDLYRAMDSCGRLGTFDALNGYFTEDALMSPAELAAMFDGSDATINQVAFGDLILDVHDVYVTFRRSLDPSLNWFNRFWTNGQFVAVQTPNLAFNSNTPTANLPAMQGGEVNSAQSIANASALFLAGDQVTTPGKTVQIPVSAKVFGDYPVRVLGLNLTVHPLDGSPALTAPVQFIPSGALGAPTIPASKHNGNYSGAWLNSAIAGLSGNASIGTLSVTLPASCPPSAAYAVAFDHVSASPNGLARLPKRTTAGLITLSDRSASSYGDGIPDSWRLRHFRTIYNLLSAASADADGDGATNWEEYKAGTDPNDAASVLRLRSGRGQPGCVIRWPSAPDKQYVLERSASLSVPAWSAISTNAGTGGDIEFQDTSGGPVSRFYRVRPLD